MFGLSGSQEALILFAVVVGVLVFYKGQGIDIGSFDPISLGSSNPGSSTGANDSGQVSTGDVP